MSLLLAVGACHGDSEEPPSDPEASCVTPNRWVGERCLVPGVGDDGCPAGTMVRDGACQPAGMTPDMCAEGFVHDGDVGCEPILPSETCPAGWVAVPGDSECRNGVSGVAVAPGTR